MTRQEFIHAKQRYVHRVLWPFYLVLGLMVLLPFLWLPLQEACPNVPLLVRMAGHAVCIGLFVFSVWFVYVHSFRVERTQSYRCPNCLKGFGGTEEAVLSSGKCHYCGHKVIDDI